MPPGEGGKRKGRNLATVEVLLKKNREKVLCERSEGVGLLGVSTVDAKKGVSSSRKFGGITSGIKTGCWTYRGGGQTETKERLRTVVSPKPYRANGGGQPGLVKSWAKPSKKSPTGGDYPLKET